MADVSAGWFRRRGLFAAVTVLAMGIAALAAYYGGTRPFADRGEPPAPAAEPGDTAPADTFRFSFYSQPRALPDIHFTDGEGHPLSLADFRGRPVLLNIWATWCVPCRTEMPSLERLQAALGRDRLLVVPLSMDRQGIPVVKAFYEKLGLKVLGMYIDASGKAARDLNTVGVPTTLLIDDEGREIGRKIGEAEWDSPGTIALLQRHLPPLASGQGR